VNIREAIKKIDRQLAKDRSIRIVEAIRKEIPNIETLIIGKKHLTVNGISIKDVNIDEYNNFDCILPAKKFSADVLCVMRVLVEELFERVDSFNHRGGIGLFIDYFEKYCDSMSVEEIQNLINIDDKDTKKDDDGFGEWLLGQSYSTGGNLKYNRKDLDKTQFTRKGKK
jgi:hypothetical protein